MYRARSLLLLFFLVVLLLVLLFRESFVLLFSEALGVISNAGGGGMALFVALYIVTCVLLLPGFILTYGAGVIFGFPLGVCAVSLGVTLGASAAFLTARYLLRDLVLEKTEGVENFRKIKRATERHGWRVVLLARLCPVVPFRFSNYVFGLTDVPFIRYVMATFFGTLPGVCLYVHLGTLIGELGRVGGISTLNANEYQTYLTGIGGLLALFIVALLLTRIATRRLEQISA